MKPDRPVLITGGSGFIGTHLTRALADRGRVVRVLSRSRPQECRSVEWCEGDVRDRTAVFQATRGVETAFHLAGLAHGRTNAYDAEAQRAVSVNGTHHLISAADECGVSRIVFVSSVAVYGRRGQVCTEETPCAPETAYGRAKLEAEAMLLAWAAETGRSCVVLRPAAVYGAGCKGALEVLARRVKHGGICPVSSARRVMSLAHVENVVEAAVAAAGTGAAKTRCYNVSDRTPYRIDQVIATLGRRQGVTARIIRVPDVLLRLGELCLAPMSRLELRHVRVVAGAFRSLRCPLVCPPALLLKELKCTLSHSLCD